MASVGALVAIDLVGLVLGVYAALTLRAFVYGNEVSQWGLRIAAPCPPPENQLQVDAWAKSLFLQLRGR